MKIVPLGIVAAVVMACAKHHGSASSTQDASGIPSGCSPMHGGIPETPGKAPVWRRGAPLATLRRDSALIVVQIVRAPDSLPLSEAHVIFGTAPDLVRAPATDVHGYTVVHLAAGRAPMLALRIGHKRLTDTITVRGGSADTLWLGLGTEKICFT
jgi:hypothetical protein